MAWIPPPTFGRRHQDNNILRGSAIFYHQGHTYYVPHEDCWDLCDVDWELMPASVYDSDGAMDSEYDIAPPMTMVPPPPPPPQRHSSDFTRQRLELSFGLERSREDYDMEELDTCADSCNSCFGAGQVRCRFCQGRRFVQLAHGEPPTSCPVCHQGRETCRQCGGSGHVARWTRYD